MMMAACRPYSGLQPQVNAELDDLCSYISMGFYNCCLVKRLSRSSSVIDRPSVLGDPAERDRANRDAPMRHYEPATEAS
jgi:hypothetical protein